MGAYSYIKKTIQSAYKALSDIYKSRIRGWKKSGKGIIKLDKPTNIPRARSVGWKAKKGYVCAVVKIKKGQRKRPSPRGGRKERHNYRYLSPAISHQTMAEQRASRKHPNCEVIGSYWIGETGDTTFYEVILADRSAKTVNAGAVKRMGRAERGLTSSGRKSRRRLKNKKKSRKKGTRSIARKPRKK